VNILIVDDDLGTGETLSIALRLHGHKVSVALSGSDGMALAGVGRFDAVLIDLRLPDMSGLALLREFRELQPGAATFLMTGYSSVQVAVDAITAGATAYLQKPFDIDQLVAVLTKGDAVVPQTSAHTDGETPSAARWATLVLAGLAATSDLTTLKRWSEVANVSQATLQNRCRAAGVSAKASLDLVRVGRAGRCSKLWGCDAAILLDADPRTVRRLLRFTDDIFDADQFVSEQHFVSNRYAIAALRQLIGASGGGGRSA
jgi:ActR/RegA family two-component response regulator